MSKKSKLTEESGQTDAKEEEHFFTGISCEGSSYGMTVAVHSNPTRFP
jgi:hypothetical protein